MPLHHIRPENSTSCAYAPALQDPASYTTAVHAVAAMPPSRDARRDNKRPLELLAAAAEITQAVRLAANALRATAPQFRNVVQWYEGDAHGSGNWGVTYRRYVDGFVKAVARDLQIEDHVF